MYIPLVDLAAQQREVDAEIRQGLDEVLANTDFIGGKAVADFEAAYAEEIGVEYCIGVSNGTDALELALRAVGVRAGGEVILPANTFIATAEAVARIGAVPRLVDVDDEYQLIDVDAVAAAITDRTEAIVPVHLFGQTAPVERLRPLADRYGIPIVEDAAQAQGASRFGRMAGSLGVVAATSFYPGKNLGAAGDAGAVTTNDPAIARTVRLLSSHGSEQKYVHEIVGMNARIDTVQAVVLRAKLRRLAEWNERRRVAADRYRELLGEVPDVRLPRTADGNRDVWHLYVVRVADRDRILSELQRAGIGAGVHYPTPLHLTGAFRNLNSRRGAFPVAERSATGILSLPVYPHITSGQQAYVVETLARSLKQAE